MSSFLTNISFLQGIAEDLVKARKMNYSQECFTYYIDQSQFVIQDLPGVKNSRKHVLKCTLIRPNREETEENQQKQEKLLRQQKCIIFLHGLGSSRLQGLPLVAQMPKKYSLCLFDMSGSGKSEGDTITYGLREKDDIGKLQNNEEAIIDYLSAKKGIKEFVLWGRSMGAVAVLLYAIDISRSDNPRNSQRSNSVKCLVLDSPFYDYSQITKQIAVQKMAVPEFLLDVGLTFIEQAFEKLLYDSQTKISYNPFQIKFNKQIKTKIPAVFLCSEKDEVVPISHSQKIMRNYRSDFQKIIMDGISHNQQRSTKAIQEVFFLISKFDEKMNRRRKNAFELQQTKQFDLTLHQSLMERRKGIAVFTPSKSKRIANQTIVPNFSQSQVKQRFFGTIDINTNKPLTRNLSRGLTRAQNQNKRGTIDLTRMRNSPYKYLPDKRNIEHIEPLYDTLNFAHMHFSSKVEPTHKKSPSPNVASMLRGKRYNNFMRKVEPKLTHSRYL